MKCAQSIVRSVLCLLFSLLAHSSFSQTLPVDSSFNSTGVLFSRLATASVAHAIIVQPDQKILLGGTGLVRHNSSGAFDSSFNDDGIVIPSFLIRSIALQSDGKIVVAGARGDTSFVVSRYTVAGRLDSTFGANGVVITSFIYRSQAYAVSIQSDGKIIAAGSTAYSLGPYGIRTNLAMARYHTNGSLDSSYGIDGKVVMPLFNENNVQLSIYAASIALRSDEKLYVAVNETLQFRAALFKTDGSLDSTFGTAGLVSFYITPNNNPCWTNGIALQQDGKIVLAGTTTTNGSRWPVFAVARLNSNGALDATFNQTGKSYNYIHYDDYATSVAIHPDGKIILAGYVRTPSTGRLLVAQYSTNGTLIGKNNIRVSNTDWGSTIGNAVAVTPSRIYVTGFSQQYQPPNNNIERSEMVTIAFLPTAMQTLPLHLVEFNATPTNSVVTCKWLTENEINTSHFNVQRSNDGQNFSTVVRVDAKGNTSTAAYSYSDASLGEACDKCKYYYRLQMVDKDGKLSYSKVETVRWQQVRLASIFPNPASSFFEIKNNTAELLEIFNHGGSLVHKQKINLPRIRVNVADYLTGAYFIRLSDSQGNYQVEKLLVK